MSRVLKSKVEEEEREKERILECARREAALKELALQEQTRLEAIAKRSVDISNLITPPISAWSDALWRLDGIFSTFELMELLYDAEDSLMVQMDGELAAGVSALTSQLAASMDSENHVKISDFIQHIASHTATAWTDNMLSSFMLILNIRIHAYSTDLLQAYNRLISLFPNFVEIDTSTSEGRKQWQRKTLELVESVSAAPTGCL